MIDTTRPRMLSICAASALVIGLTPIAAKPAISSGALVEVSTAVALTSGAVDSILPGLENALSTAVLDTPGAADAFDIVGLINAEIAAAQGLFNSLFSLPVTLYNDVTSVIDNLINLDFGMAFSVAITIPQDIINYVLGLPGLLVNTAFNMAFVLPGEYLFNFG